MSHLGRPTEGQFETQYSLQPVANDLSSKLGVEVQLITDWSNGFEVPKRANCPSGKCAL